MCHVLGTSYHFLLSALKTGYDQHTEYMGGRERALASELMGEVRYDGCKAFSAQHNQLAAQAADRWTKVQLPEVFSPNPQLPYKAGANLKNKPT